MEGQVESIPENEKKSNLSYGLISQILFGIFGLILVIFPQVGMKIGVVLLGLWFLYEGGRSLIQTLKKTKAYKDKSRTFALVKSILLLILSLIMIFRPGPAAKLGLGVFFFLGGLFLVVQGLFLVMFQERERIYLALLLFFSGILLMISPWVMVQWFFRLIGILLLLWGILGGYALWKKHPRTLNS